MLADAEGEKQVSHFSGCRCALGHAFQRSFRHAPGIARLRQKAAGHGTEHHPRRRRIRQAARQQQAQIFLFGKDRECRFIRIRRDHHFGENRRDAFRRRRIKLAIGRDNTAKGGNRITQQSAVPSAG